MNQTVHDAKDSAKDKAQEAGQQAQEKAKGQIDSRTSDAGEQLQDKAEGLHEVGDQLRERGDDTFAQVADRVADWTEDAARYLRNADADRILGDVEGYARRQPWAVAAGGLLLGFAASRVVRAGSEKRSSSSGSIGRYSTGSASPEPVDLTRRSGTGTGYGTLPTGYEPLSSDLPNDDPVPATDPAPLGDPEPYRSPSTTPSPAPSTQPGPSSTGYTDGNR